MRWAHVLVGFAALLVGCKGQTDSGIAPASRDPQPPAIATAPVNPNPTPRATTSAVFESKPAETQHLPQAKDGDLPFRLLALYAHPIAGTWHFPSRYHYHEWRAAAVIKGRPAVWPGTDGQPMPLHIDRPARPGLVIVVDDLGNHWRAAQRLASLPITINAAVLPFTPHAQRTAALFRQRGADVLLHLPMEPERYPHERPGYGALFITMPAQQRQLAVGLALAELPEAVGVNNHMGSRLTTDEAAMKDIASVLATKGLFFLDSRTSGRSIAQSVMARSGVPAFGRTHFLDQVPEDTSVQSALDEALDYARRNGFAVALAHPNQATLRVLAKAAERLQLAGVESVTMRQLLVQRGTK